MHQRTQELPVTMEAPGMKGHNAIWGDMAIGYLELPAIPPGSKRRPSC